MDLADITDVKSGFTGFGDHYHAFFQQIDDIAPHRPEEELCHKTIYHSKPFNSRSFNAFPAVGET